MGVADRHGEADYDMTRAGEWADRSSRSTGVSRRRVLQMLAAVPPLLATTGWRPAAAQTAPAPTILKPLPPEWFTVLGTNAEMRWDALQGQGFTVPNERFFVRNHTSTPTIDARTWRLRVFGSGLRRNEGIELTYRDLRRMRAGTITEVSSAPATDAGSSATSRPRRPRAPSGTWVRSAWPAGGACRSGGARSSTGARGRVRHRSAAST